MPAGSTIDKELCRLATAKEEHERMLDLSHLLQQLWHHHLSQAKPVTTPCSKQYNQELANRLAWHLGFRKDRPPCLFDGSVQRVPMTESSGAKLHKIRYRINGQIFTFKGTHAEVKIRLEALQANNIEILKETRGRPRRVR